jgi:hypothetical protein
LSRFVLILGLALSTACGGDDDGGVDGGGSDSGGVDGGPVDNGVAYDDIFSGACAGSLRCGSGDVESACACVPVPSEEDIFATNRVGCSELPTEMGRPRTPEDDYCDPAAASATPNLGCMMEGMYHERGEVQMVTLHGVVDVFGNGGDADGILVQVYEEGADGGLGAMLGEATSSIASSCAETEDQIDNDMVVGERQLGYYTIPNIPTETPLIVKTSGAPDFWRDLYSYNVQILNGEVEDGTAGMPCGDAPGGPRHKYRARTLSRSDYQSIPLTASLVGGITPGNGAVAGEIHDCDDVRLEYAQVAVTPEATVLTYFNDNPSNPIPSVGRREGTSQLGLYAALDVPAGPVNVAAVGRVDGALVSLGWYRAQVFANSVTAVTLRGLRSQQVP